MHRELLGARQQALQIDREAVCVTLTQYDPTTTVEGVGTLDQWFSRTAGADDSLNSLSEETGNRRTNRTLTAL